MGFTLAMALISLVSVNIIHWQGHVVMFPASTAIGVPVFSLLTSLLAASAGVLISLRAPTARQAAQMLSIAVMLVLFVPVFGIQALPDDVKAGLAASATRINPLIAAGALVAVLLIVDGVLISLGLLASEGRGSSRLSPERHQHGDVFVPWDSVLSERNGHVVEGCTWLTGESKR